MGIFCIIFYIIMNSFSCDIVVFRKVKYIINFYNFMFLFFKI